MLDFKKGVVWFGLTRVFFWDSRKNCVTHRDGKKSGPPEAWKWMVGKTILTFWEGNFSGAMLKCQTSGVYHSNLLCRKTSCSPPHDSSFFGDFFAQGKVRQACAEGNVGSSVWRFGGELCEESSTGLKETMLSPFKDISEVPSKMDRFWVIQKIRNHQQTGWPKSLPSLR